MLLFALAVGMLIASAIHYGVTGIAIALILVLLAIVVIDAILASRARPRAPRTPSIPADADPLRAVRTLAARAGGGVWLGAGDDGQWRFARPERAVLLLGPPRSGKTSGVIIPAVLAHTGPAIVTSTKPDVARATARARARDGRVWVFDPTGSSRPPAGVEQLRWSPVTSALTWDGAVVIARAMTVTVGTGTTDRSHWANRAQALLAPLLHAAAVHGKEMDTVVDWVMRHELDEPGILLEDPRANRLAFGSLLGLLNTEDRERSSVFSAAADALQAYTSEGALMTAGDPNFDPAAFIAGGDTVYIWAPAEEQDAVAPVVCGLLAEVRRATYRAHAADGLPHPVLFALDEVANIAPLQELPQIASEGGGQGLTLLAALQDLSQARARWGKAADGFLTLFGAKLLLPGIADTTTLEAVSTMLGEFDRQVISRSSDANLFSDPGKKSRTVSTQRTRILSPGDVAGIPAGHGLHLDGTRWELLSLTAAHRDEPWRTLTAPARS
ncbi:MAG: type IV secretory system conjugative DNA transfer family protein [Solirubrobacteraceae bacterium]